MGKGEREKGKGREGGEVGRDGKGDGKDPLLLFGQIKPAYEWSVVCLGLEGNHCTLSFSRADPRGGWPPPKMLKSPFGLLPLF